MTAGLWRHQEYSQSGDAVAVDLLQVRVKEGVADCDRCDDIARRCGDTLSISTRFIFTPPRASGWDSHPMDYAVCSTLGRLSCSVIAVYTYPSSNAVVCVVSASLLVRRSGRCGHCGRLRRSASTTVVNHHWKTSWLSLDYLQRCVRRGRYSHVFEFLPVDINPNTLNHTNTF